MLCLPAALGPPRVRRAFLAGMVAAAGWAGACFAGVRPSEIGPERPRFPRAFGQSSSAQRLRAKPCAFCSHATEPETWRSRLRNKPRPTLPVDAFAFVRRGCLGPSRASTARAPSALCGFDGHASTARSLRAREAPSATRFSRVSNSFEACGRREGCRGPRWAETTFFPTLSLTRRRHHHPASRSEANKRRRQSPQHQSNAFAASIRNAMSTLSSFITRSKKRRGSSVDACTSDGVGDGVAVPLAGAPSRA